MISYEPLRTYMFDNDISWYKLAKQAHLNNDTIESLKVDGNVESISIDMICEEFNLVIENVMVHVPTAEYVYVPDPVGPKNAKNKNPRKPQEKKSSKSNQ